MAIGAARELLNTVRELNLGEIKEKADQPFTLLVAGPPPLGQELAKALSSTPGKSGVHPWIEVRELPLPLAEQELSRYALALLVLPGSQLDEAADAARRRLRAEGVPVITVVVSPHTLAQVGSDVARQGESARVTLASLDAELMRGQLGPDVLEALPEERRIALARRLPLFRAAFARELIESTSRANAIYSASTGVAEIVPVLTIPLTAADIVVLSKNQLVMAFKLALAAGKEGSSREIMGEVLSVIGGGLLFRQIARELVGLIPVVGIVPKVAVAYAGTWVIGRSVHLWATEGERVNREQIRRFYDEALARGQAIAGRLVERARDLTPSLPARRKELPPPAAESLPAPVEAPVDEEASARKEGLLQRVRQRLPF